MWKNKEKSINKVSNYSKNHCPLISARACHDNRARHATISKQCAQVQSEAILALADVNTKTLSHASLDGQRSQRNEGEAA